MEEVSDAFLVCNGWASSAIVFTDDFIIICSLYISTNNDIFETTDDTNSFEVIRSESSED